jgi:hypothetical protein
MAGVLYTEYINANRFSNMTLAYDRACASVRSK